MSGFEIAGVVLGAYPIIYDTAKDLRGVLKKARAWWFFEREFDDFVSEVNKEYVSFSQILEILLDPLDLTPDERRRLQDESHCSLWHATHIQVQLRQRVQPKYHVWFMGRLAEMNTALTELYTMLPVGKIYLLDSNSVEAELFKLKRSFSNRKNELLETVQENNNALFHFLEKASYITQSNSPMAPSNSYSRASLKKLRRLQSHSHYAFQLIQNKWACKCPQHHYCSITVDDSDTSLPHSLLLSNEEMLTQIPLDFQLITRELGLPQSPTPEPERTKQEEVTSLKQLISWKRAIKRLKSERSRGIPILGISALSLVSNPFSSEHHQVQLKKAETKLTKKVSIPTINSEPSVFATQARHEQTNSDIQKKTVLDAQRPNGAFQHRVRFAEEHSNVSTSSPSLHARKIENLCEIVARPISESYDAYEDIGQDVRVLLHVRRREEMMLHRATVEDFIIATPRRDKRVQVALAVLRSILCLGTSPWVPLSWNKSHLILIDDKSGDLRPYFFNSSLLSNISSAEIPESQVEKTRASLFAIGVLLLELLFRETFEKQPFRTQFLNNMGQANEVTDLCAALQWHQRVGDECGYELSDAIRRCIVCAFDAPLNLGDPDFIEAVWYGVVQPLEKFLSAWKRDPVRQE